MPQPVVCGINTAYQLIESTVKMDRFRRTVVNVKTLLGIETFSLPKEVGLRRRIKQLKKFYKYKIPASEYTWNEKVVEEFLSTRPTIPELKTVFRPPNSSISAESQSVAGRFDSCYSPDPERPEYLKFDSEKYHKILKREAIQRQEIMQQIIKNRQEQKKR